jgi:hypothetical protein
MDVPPTDQPMINRTAYEPSSAPPRASRAPGMPRIHEFGTGTAIQNNVVSDATDRAITTGQ